jgi:hypothetical protein
MSLSETTKVSTRKEWRNLGFFYDYDEKRGEWHFIGSRSGLEKFRDILSQYASNPKNDQKSEHDHYGPYMYLEIMTWDSPNISDHCIQGTLSDLKKLSDLVGQKLKNALPNDSFIIQQEYAKDAQSSLVFEIKEDNFDPASADPMLQESIQ